MAMKMTKVRNSNGGGGFTSRHQSAHENLLFVLIIGQVIGLFPVQGIFEKDVRLLHFKWLSFRVVYPIVVVVAVGFQTLAYTFYVAYTGVQFYDLVSIAFFGFCFTLCILFFKLAIEWPSLMQYWETSEYPVVKMFGKSKNLSKRITITTFSLALFAIIEHLLFLIKVYEISKKCVGKKNVTALDDVLMKNHAHIFRFVAYAKWKGIVMQLINLIATFAWNYMDLFIMIVSLILASRFHQLNVKLRSDLSPVMKREEYWRNIRNSYTKLYKLCKTVDRSISPLILVSFAVNLFIILVQLFNSLMPLPGPLEKIYFVYSFVFLIARTASVAMHAAWINDEGKKPVLILNGVVSASYNAEVKRFLEQVSCDPVALTGLRFFTITRKLVLSVAGAIVTYELILINFNSSMLLDMNNNSNNATNTDC